MNLTAYTDEAREDLTDLERLRAIMDELMTVLADFERRIDTLENA
jgi:hypothetical protein